MLDAIADAAPRLAAGDQPRFLTDVARKLGRAGEAVASVKPSAPALPKRLVSRVPMPLLRRTRAHIRRGPRQKAALRHCRQSEEVAGRPQAARLAFFTGSARLPLPQTLSRPWAKLVSTGREGTLEHGDGRSTLRSRDPDARPGTPRRGAAVVADRLARLLEAPRGESRRHRLHPVHYGHRHRRAVGWLVLPASAEPDRKFGAADAVEPEFRRLPSRGARSAGTARSVRSRGAEKRLPLGAWEQQGSGARWRAARGG